MVNLGDKVKDLVTGFTGIAVGKTTWLYGCHRISVQPLVDKEGKMVDALTFDEPQLEVIKPRKKEKVDRTKGGPRPEVSKRPSLSRR